MKTVSLLLRGLQSNLSMRLRRHPQLVGKSVTQLGIGGGDDAQLRRLEACKILAKAYSEMLKEKY